MKSGMSNIFAALCLVSLFFAAGCTRAQVRNSGAAPEPETAPTPEIAKITNPGRVVHVLVALCDNENQGIVPVPAFLGNGEDAGRNLYWGAAFGVRTFFGRSANWTRLAEIKNPSENVLERLVFRHRTQNVYLVADAYRGSKMKATINDFFAAAAGTKLENVAAGDKNLQIFGSADLVAFIGHNGLMDFSLENEIVKKDAAERDAVILACASRQYFAAHLRRTSARPLLWTSNLMAPEAYILHDALEGWANNETPAEVQTRAARAYAKYQKISLRSAQKLLVTGW